MNRLKNKSLANPAVIPDNSGLQDFYAFIHLVLPLHKYNL